MMARSNGRFSRIHRSKHKSREAIRDPVRFLVIAIIHQALVDAEAGKRVPKRAVASANAFLESDAYLDLCGFLSIRPSAAKEVADLAKEVQFQ